MSMFLVVGIAWVALAVPVAALIGRSIRLADERAVAGIGDRLPTFAADQDPPLRLPSLTLVRRVV
jgi:hypothetical protein